MDLLDDNEKLAYLGPGYTLYFVFLKYVIAFLVIFLAVIGVFELASNAQGDHCKNDPDCSGGVVINLSMYNKSDNPETMLTQQWLNLGLMLIMIIMIQLLRRQKRKTTAECDERDVSTSDYTLMVENIPRDSNIDHKEELRKLFEGLPHAGAQFKVTKINLTYNLQELTQYISNHYYSINALF